MKSEDGHVNFDSNYANDGSTVYALYSLLISTNILMTNNLGNYGGCFNLLESDLTANANTFTNNYSI